MDFEKKNISFSEILFLTWNTILFQLQRIYYPDSIWNIFSVNFTQLWIGIIDNWEPVNESSTIITTALAKMEIEQLFNSPEIQAVTLSALIPFSSCTSAVYRKPHRIYTSL